MESLQKFMYFSSQEILLKTVIPILFGTRHQFHGRQLFHGPGMKEEWFQDDSSTLHLPCILFLLFLQYLYVIYNVIVCDI